MIKSRKDEMGSGGQNELVQIEFKRKMKEKMHHHVQFLQLLIFGSCEMDTDTYASMWNEG